MRREYPQHGIEKFEQEVWWRIYWKGWLEQRPALWSRYREEVAELEWSERAREVASGNSGLAIMDYFAGELTRTGYLHNHARMWWAAYWVHVERLPWQLGAEFFLRHLLDGDSASNTLSWRWVAGLHTRGKSYLARRSNLEKYVDPCLLEEYSGGLSRLEAPSALELAFVEHPPIAPVTGSSLPGHLPERFGIWIHEEDLVLEEGPLGRLSPVSLGVFPRIRDWKKDGYSEGKRKFLLEALRDGAERAEEHFQVMLVYEDSDAWEDSLLSWAKGNELSAVLTMRPATGPLGDCWEDVDRKLADAGIELKGVRRGIDLAAFPKATAGFFGFWKKTAGLRG